MICGYCGEELDNKPQQLFNNEVICESKCKNSCGECSSINKRCENCFECKRNLHISNKIQKQISKFNSTLI